MAGNNFMTEHVQAVDETHFWTSVNHSLLRQMAAQKQKNTAVK